METRRTVLLLSPDIVDELVAGWTDTTSDGGL